MEISKIYERLIEDSEKDYKEFNSKLCPDTNREMLGIRIPNLRKFAKEIVKQNDWEEFLNKAEDRYFEEVLLEGFVIAYSKIDLESKLEYIKKFISKIDSWAITDTFTPTLKIKKEDMELYWNFIMNYIKSDKEFEIRFAIISMLDYYICDEYIDEVINILDGIQTEYYYVRMAIAWTLAEVGIKYNDKLMKYLKNCNLDKFTFNKTLQKMIESYRISDIQKDDLRKMKRK